MVKNRHTMKNFIKKTGIITLGITIVFIAWFGIQLTYGWTGPTQNPLNGNIPELINQTYGNQLKTGSLTITGFFESLSRAIFNSNVGIGVSSAPAAKLHLDGGNFLITNGAINSPSASIGNISITGTGTSTNITNNVDIGNNLYIGNGLNSGANGIDSSGPISVSTTSYFNGSVSVGTTNPGSNKLKIEGGIMRAYGGLILEQTSVTPSETGRLWIIP